MALILDRNLLIVATRSIFIFLIDTRAVTNISSTRNTYQVFAIYVIQCANIKLYEIYVCTKSRAVHKIL